MNLSLRQINADNFYQICQLQVAPEQKNHVDGNAISLAEANFMAFPWFRGIYIGDNPVGFILVNADTDSGKFFLWRFMLDQSQQFKGYGRTAIHLLVEELQKEFSIEKLYTSVVTAEDGPEGFYLSCGFKPTGALIEGREVELCMSIPTETCNKTKGNSEDIELLTLANERGPEESVSVSIDDL